MALKFKEYFGPMVFELFGTLIYVLMGTAGEGLNYLENPSGGRSTLAGFVSFFIWGLALAVGIYIAGGHSGGQLNGSVSVGMSLVGKMRREMLIQYFISQMIGALIGSGITLGLYRDSMKSGFIISPIPKQGFMMYHFFMSSFLSTFFFLLILSGICDVKNMKVPRAMLGLCIGFTYALISIVFSYCWSGAVILNPTADMGMRVMNAFYGNNVFWTESLISYFGSFLGGACGSVLYTFAIQYHWERLPMRPPAPAGRITTSVQPPLKKHDISVKTST